MAGVSGLGGLLTGGLGNVIPSAFGGAMWGMGMGGALKGAVTPVTKGLVKLGVNPGLAKNIGSVLPAAGLTAVSLTPTLSNLGRGASNIAANTSQNVVGGGAHLLNQQGVGPYQDPLGGLPPGTINRMIGPDGGIWYQLAPGGPASAQRIGRVLGAQADASVINTLGNALYGQTERVAKAELERQAAAEQLKANIDMAKQMSLNSQVAGLNIAQNASQSMGDAMSQRNMFRYF
jgi:hypothetical protein